MSSIPARLIGKPSPKGEQSTLTLTLAMLFFLISKQMGKQSNSLFVALMKLLFRLIIDYLGGSAVSYFLRIWIISFFFYVLLNISISLEEYMTLDNNVWQPYLIISKWNWFSLTNFMLVAPTQNDNRIHTKLKRLLSVRPGWGHEWKSLLRSVFAQCDSKTPEWLQAKGKRDVSENAGKVFVWHFQR